MSVLQVCIRELLKGKKLIFFGCGTCCSAEISVLPEGKISYFCDDHPMKVGGSFCGRPIYGFETLKKENPDNIALIINTDFYKGISRRLIDTGITNIYSSLYKNADEPINLLGVEGSENLLEEKYDSIKEKDLDELAELFTDEESKTLFWNIIKKYKTGNFNFSDLRSKSPMYFNELLKLGEEEVFADCGAYDGSDIVGFIFFLGGGGRTGKYSKIYAFEPDIANYSVIRRTFSDIENIVLANAAVGKDNRDQLFDMRGTMTSRVIDNADGCEKFLTPVKTITLDDFCNDALPTFIKMDIEGGEYSAILGAQRLIADHKPKLAISVYHCEDDLWRIPMMIHSLRQDYQFFLRHHTNTYVDTVLYCR